MARTQVKPKNKQTSQSVFDKFVYYFVSCGSAVDENDGILVIPLWMRLRKFPMDKRQQMLDLVK